jgi:uncharacterized protein YjcR
MKNNQFSQSQIQTMTDILQNESFDYQAAWLRVGKLNIDRSITKSRQIGATYLFSREALLNALTTGEDQIWFGHTVEHARVALMYMKNLSARAGVRLVSNGYSLQLDDGAVISFVGEELIAARWQVTSILMSSGGSITPESGESSVSYRLP